ncbi:hypothetical protein DQ04_01741000 [Trypanosoma grayi]|uniref:hypothetical protein n=1 Tax=Trypanosoma grayi TaxID=71804 RepID=UPI0004F44A72|nr:hypothetical protein DQ04_01741000 [Trypanosoma grayi]KEG12398.1 hypothetical protein DQ04_01741000 [Trypanosoma grayi]
MLPDGKSSFFRKNSPYKERGPTMTIPNIPKVTDERARMKLLCDYEKYEPELFKHHLGTPETTRTIGLKLVPVDFDRRVPSRNEPTIAERELEARKRNKNQKKSSLTGPARKRMADSHNAAVPEAAAVAATRSEHTNRLSSARASSHSPNTASVPVPEHVLPPSARRNGSARSGESLTTSYSPTDALAGEKPKEAASGRTSPRRVQPRTQRLRPQKPQKLPQDAGGEKDLLDTKVVEKLLHSVPPALRKGDNSPSIPQVPPIRKPEEVLNAERCGNLLRVLLNTPPEFSESFHLDLRNIDLRWMRGSRYPDALVTLQTWRGAEKKNDSIQSLNSPRSVIVLLRNGIAMEDLLPSEIRDDDPLLPKDQETRRLVKQMRMERDLRTRESLLQKLRDEYVPLCRAVNLADVLKAFRSTEKRENSVELPTSIKVGHERRQRILETSKKQMEKQLAFVKNVHERQLVAEERHRKVEEEARARIERKKEEELLARQRAAERLATQRQKAVEMEAVYQKELEERHARAEEKNARRIEAQQRLIEQRRAERMKMAEERQRRFERIAELQEQQKLQVQRKYEEKDDKLQRLREEQERRREDMHQKMLEKAAKSVELRELARQRAALHEERVRQAAAEQQRKVEERLLRFHHDTEEARAKRAQQEEVKRERFKEIISIADHKLATFKEEVLEKQMQHEKNFIEIQRQRQAELLAKREREREEMEATAFAVVRNKRMTEFEKLEMVLRLLSKRDAAVFLERQRELLLHETHKSRDAMLEERNMLKKQISQQTELLH